MAIAPVTAWAARGHAQALFLRVAHAQTITSVAVNFSVATTAKPPTTRICSVALVTTLTLWRAIYAKACLTMAPPATSTNSAHLISAPAMVRVAKERAMSLVLPEVCAQTTTSVLLRFYVATTALRRMLGICSVALVTTLTLWRAIYATTCLTAPSATSTTSAIMGVAAATASVARAPATH